VDAPASSFYFDLASPYAYLAAERILHALPGPAEWRPVLARELSAPTGTPVGDPLSAFRCEQERDALLGDVERRAAELGLQPLRWPEPFPFDSGFAMRAATYARSIGRVVPFAQAAFRQAFAGGRDLEDADNVLIAAAACEMHPAAVLRGAELRSVQTQLADAAGDAGRKSIETIPAIVVDDAVYEGERAIDEAAAHMLQLGIGAPR
jgi:2-hydroxychromene-2-carboxylate isomerase